MNIQFMSPELTEYFKKSSEEEQLKLIAEAARTVKSKLQARDKASNAAFSCNSVRTGIRGGKRTSLDAKHSNACQAYDWAVETLKGYMKIYLKL